MTDILVQIRRGKTVEWTQSEPILAPGELGLDIDRKEIKVGNGIDTWSKLDTFPGTPDFTQFIFF